MPPWLPCTGTGKGYTFPEMTDMAASVRDGDHVAPPPGADLQDFQIVPRKGLIGVAAAFLLLIVGIAWNQLWALEFLHVVGGAAWTVIDLFMGFVIGPILGRLTIPARIEVTKRLMPKMVLIMPTVVTLSLAAGWQLGTKLGTVNSAYSHHAWIVASYIVVGVMAVIALGLLEPANVAVLVELKKPQPNPTIIERLMKRFIYASAITGAMQIAILVIMTRVASTL